MPNERKQKNYIFLEQKLGGTKNLSAVGFYKSVGEES